MGTGRLVLRVEADWDTRHGAIGERHAEGPGCSGAGGVCTSWSVGPCQAGNVGGDVQTAVCGPLCALQEPRAIRRSATRAGRPA